MAPLALPDVGLDMGICSETGTRKVFMGVPGAITRGFCWRLMLTGVSGAGPSHDSRPFSRPMQPYSSGAACRKKPWQRPRAVLSALVLGAHPSGVVWRVATANAALIALALVSIRYPVPALVGAIAVVAVLLVHLQRLAGPRAS